MKTCTHKVSYIHIKVSYVMSYVMLNAYDMSYDMCVSACMCVCVCVCIHTRTHTHTHGLEKKKRGNSFFGLHTHTRSRKKKRGNSFFGLHELSLQTNFFVAVGRVHGSSGAPLIRPRPDTPGCCREPADMRCAAASDSVSIVANGQPVGVCAMDHLARGEGARSDAGALHIVCEGRPHARSGWQSGYRRQCCAMQGRTRDGLERHEVGEGKCFRRAELTMMVMGDRSSQPESKFVDQGHESAGRIEPPQESSRRSTQDRVLPAR